MALTREEMNIMREQEEQIVASRARANLDETTLAGQAIAIQDEEKSILREQLDLSDELDTIEHLLRGHVLRDDKNTGMRKWADPEDPDMIILTEHGIYLIMNTIMFYINKNTLLSNYDGDTINKKMEDFAETLNDTIFMEYEKVFQYPTFEECKKVLLERIKKKTELRSFALNLMGKEVIEKEIKKEFVDELEGKIDLEITKIKEQIIKNKLKRFLIIIREIQDAVHSTYLRAYGGQERRTLRQRIHVSENSNPFSQNQGKGKLNALNYGQWKEVWYNMVFKKKKRRRRKK